MQLSQASQATKTLRRSLKDIDAQMSQLVDRIVDATNDAVIAAYEQRLEKLEREKLVLAEKLQTSGKPQRPFGEVFELALAFLANPCNLRKSDRYEDKQTVLRLAFDDRLQYCRENGFRTAETSIIFRVL